ncbi:Rod shape-determining protein MreB [Bombilactobacillus mellis]|uniref:Cell shape-determining protein MreB n=1 Tax=Bombilactobacillus mellis TaxID=1218508 RepID=A0A0F4KRN7_9LACO|nr:rod shape-determining protein [Bombilactobacillus mellis]MBI0107362.1 rod shape-determining protein [Lactobacillus sp. W8086]MBI0108827.1 rod shape-determining protein [Lactobacillus sp. W8085]MBI0112044.1 rod shape-determining protein [Lactobacillus sp. W8088]MBI0115760.1 rod shape-determining protein [Lactobacillus sp. W8087]MBI0119484.1 rod shape-determining protein [Lactobacillus sp. W8089]MBI0131450.1 rod shape-determining protein [Lactobacillus sp. W8090]
MAKSIGIDLGTANILINVKGEGIVINEPSVVAINTQTNEVVAVGTEAYKMVGRTPGNIKAIRPLKDGVIADFDITEKMLKYFIEKTNVKTMFSRPKIMICCPTNITSIEQKSIIEAAEQTGSKDVYLELEPKVAAVGAGMDIFKPQGNMVIDIGGGTSDIAILSMGDIAASKSIRLAGDKMNLAIQSYVKVHHNIVIGERTAEDVKKQIGTAFEPNPENTITIRGRDVQTGLPVSVTISETDVQQALNDIFYTIIDGAKTVLEQAQPELSADIIDHGIMLTGGGSLVRGIDKLFARELQVPVIIAENPLDTVALGTGILLDHIENNEQY